MTLETYLKNRDLFESRYKPNELGTCYINSMNKGIRRFELFFAIYGHDRQIIVTSGTYGVDRRKRYSVPFKKMIGTKISIKNTEKSFFEKYPESFYKLKSQLKTN